MPLSFLSSFLTSSLAIVLAFPHLLYSQETTRPPFRVDADGPVNPGSGGGGSKKDAKPGVPDWYQIQEGVFPPAGSAHYVSGELTMVDHLERRFHLRVDRNDSQDRAVWDLPLESIMLPYGSIWYQGAWADLRDIPLGTHLHGQFYLRAPDDQTPAPDRYFRRRTPEIDFRRCYRLEDDFTFRLRQKQMWKVDSLNLAEMKLTATLHDAEGRPVPGTATTARIFDLLSSTKVYQGEGFVDLQALQPGQSVLFNLTWVTLYGPGRITDVYLDDTARQLATAQQLERHRILVRERGLPGWIDAVDDEPQNVTITFFDNVDPSLFAELKLAPPPPAPGSAAAATYDPKAVYEPRGGVAVALPSLMTYDPVNDRKSGPVVEIKENHHPETIGRGNSGVQITVKVDMMLEGYRPKRIVRFYPQAWRVFELPREEKYEGRE
ncbi:MAG: hypothetical protein ACAI34_21190 [Verrucomicrobium sp.]